MNTITITPENLIIEPRGLDKVWSFTNRLEIPVAHVRGATFDPGANSEPKGFRGPGLGVPGKWAGTYTREGEKFFWNVSGPGATIVIQLADERFDRLYLTVDEPRALVDEINSALPRG
jgi:hypothetical protein